MRYGRINKTDIANGEGVRVAFWVSGCRAHCPGCFNLEAQSFEYGEIFTDNTISEILEAAKPSYISGLTVLGGEPLEPENLESVTTLCQIFKFLYRDKSVWLYTGYDFEEVRDLEVMNFVDVLVDGRFMEDQKDISLHFRGSRNQRLIDVPETRRSGSITLWRSKYDKTGIE
jgi:anaerobic ribonucleoside-triphosphate reductase activating protein